MLMDRYSPPVATAMSLCGRYAVRTMKVAAKAIPDPKPLGKMVREAKGEVCPCQVSIRVAYEPQAQRAASHSKALYLPVLE